MRNTEAVSMEMAVASGVPEPMTKATARSMGTTIRRAKAIRAMGSMVRRTQPSYVGGTTEVGGRRSVVTGGWTGHVVAIDPRRRRTIAAKSRPSSRSTTPANTSMPLPMPVAKSAKQAAQ